jgi:hypothetical protein
VAEAEAAQRSRPDDRAARFTLCQAYGQLGLEMSRHDATAKDCEGYYRKAIALGEALCRDFPDDHRYHSSLGAARHNLALRLRTVSRHDEALPLVKAAVESQLSALKGSPGQPKYQEFLGNHYGLLAGAHLTRGDHAAAAAAALKLRDVSSPAGAHAERAASHLAACYRKVNADRTITAAQRKAVAEWYAADAVASLRTARTQGWKTTATQLQASTTYGVFRARADFQALLRELEVPAKP